MENLQENAINTAKEMIIQRGYNIVENLEDKIIGENSHGENIVIFTQEVLKFNIERVKEYISLLNKLDIKKCIIIYSQSVTPMTKKLIGTIEDIEIEPFTQDELQYNITKHRLVPQHIRLPKDKAIEFKHVYGLKWPTILKSDPVSRFYNYKRGDIIKIIRNNNKNKFVSYRIVKV